MYFKEYLNSDSSSIKNDNKTVFEKLVNSYIGLYFNEYGKTKFGGYIGYENSFYNNEFKINKGDLLYLFSDGYADQFGGLDGKKFMYRRFEELLLEVNKLPMEEQKETLNKRLIKWKGSNDQVDDILVIGIKI